MDLSVELLISPFWRRESELVGGLSSEGGVGGEITRVSENPFRVCEDVFQGPRPCFILIKRQSHTSISNPIFHDSTGQPQNGKGGFWWGDL
jgi:hypothetical protein